MIRLPPRSTQSRSSAASDVYKRQIFETSKANETAASRTAPTRCENLSNQTTMHVGSLSSYPAALHLSKSERAVLEGGGMLITDPKLVADGQVRFVGGTARLGASGVIGGNARVLGY